MHDKLELSLLIDYYGAFLTDNQLELITMSTDEDYSLSEIAEEKGISRQGVRDALLRGEKQLYDMEQKLGLVKRDRRMLELVAQMADEVSHCNADCAEYRKINLLLKELTGIMEGNDGV
ncbi:MAG: DNA-binding protein [Christensenellaceae bacterium]|nr:DNA-binding protein [Christensenellaceae bacterium]